MIIIGIKEDVVELCVSITPDQLVTVQEMYPDYLLQEQTGSESVGWVFDGIGFSNPNQV